MSQCISRPTASLTPEEAASGTRRTPTWCGKKSGYAWPNIDAILAPGKKFLPGTPEGHFSTLPCRECLIMISESLLLLLESDEVLGSDPGMSLYDTSEKTS